MSGIIIYSSMERITCPSCRQVHAFSFLKWIWNTRRLYYCPYEFNDSSRAYIYFLLGLEYVLKLGHEVIEPHNHGTIASICPFCIYPLKFVDTCILTRFRFFKGHFRTAIINLKSVLKDICGQINTFRLLISCDNIYIWF